MGQDSDPDPGGSMVKIGSGSGADPQQFLPDPLRNFTSIISNKIKLIVVK